MEYMDPMGLKPMDLITDQPMGPGPARLRGELCVGVHSAAGAGGAFRNWGGWWGDSEGICMEVSLIQQIYVKNLYSCREKNCELTKIAKKHFQKVMFWFVFLGTL